MTKLDTLLAGLARERSTGALRLGRNGTIFLSDGRVTYMECAQTPGVERLLAARGVMTEAALRGLEADGGCERLLAEGPVTQGELQYAVLGVVLDAAFFLLPMSGTRPKFRPGERHWLGEQWYFDVSGLVRECARRRAQLAQIWPSADVDILPVRPAARLPGHGVALSRIQWEIVVRADHKATPLELARQIGRSGYSVLLAVRRLAASGLLAPPPPEAARTEPAGRRQKALPGDEPQNVLPKRERQALAGRPPHDPGPAPPLGPPITGDPTDLALLMRLKRALEELS
ncbi:hypothetical protein SAMN05444920_10840 [Nonomuraea solani]|uniref:Uncharacterized protein n=1 Tax=Nonomuraea solani TaxID=1144553 RepID=A0A1H6E5R7_9ACTN|nr:hypothetical protein [Nonomuraea solani]SEG93118.1 hypothetical protein SAMN05444920_10840 [Nonomuraea solani]